MGFFFVKHTTAISDGLTETLTASFRLKNLLLLLLPRAVSDLPPASSTASHPTAPPPQSIGPLASLFLILSSLTSTPLFSSVPPTDLIFSVSSWRARLKWILVQRKAMRSLQGGKKKRMWNGDNKTARKIDEGELGEGGWGNSRDDEVAPKQKVVMN